MRIEAARQAVADLPMTPRVQARLRETARLLSTHYSTRIEGNRLTLEEAIRVIQKDERLPGRQRDEKEVLGYYRALDELEKLAAKKAKVTETLIQTLHALVMGGKRGKAKPTPYRDGQNVIRDSRNGAMVYLPPEAKDVPLMMGDLVKWLETKEKERLPCPLLAAIVHYQFATIHPYYDGNGRTARLLTTLVLHLGGYDLKGFFSLEEYYARDLPAYYHALAVGPSHNYYMGRAEAEITPWIEYFCVGTADAFENVRRRAKEEARSGKGDKSRILRQLDARQRMVLGLFRKSERITAAQVGKTLGLTGRTARHLCQRWAEEGFFVVVDPSKKARKYGLNATLERTK
ncbi:MAG: Fic family protein [Deltaproteobacteria bacterium]|nr:Fic family protein [Deltaproteobacteria bacterium]